MLENSQLQSVAFGWSLMSISVLSAVKKLSSGDYVKKISVRQGLPVWDSLTLVCAAALICLIPTCYLLDAYPEQLGISIIIQIGLTSVAKILAQICYFYSIQLGPLSSTIPYLSWNSVFLVISGYFLFEEIPTMMGIAGCALIVLGAYLKQTRTNSSKQNRHQITVFGQQVPISSATYMMLVSLIWTYTTAHEKHILQLGITPCFLLTGQKIFMTSILVLFQMKSSNFNRLKQEISLHWQEFFISGFLQALSSVTQFMGMKHLFVGLATAFKRAGSIIASSTIGFIFLKEDISKYNPLIELNKNFQFISFPPLVMRKNGSYPQKQKETRFNESAAQNLGDEEQEDLLEHQLIKKARELIQVTEEPTKGMERACEKDILINLNAQKQEMLKQLTDLQQAFEKKQKSIQLKSDELIIFPSNITGNRLTDIAARAANKKSHLASQLSSKMESMIVANQKFIEEQVKEMKELDEQNLKSNNSERNKLINLEEMAAKLEIQLEEDRRSLEQLKRQSSSREFLSSQEDGQLNSYLLKQSERSKFNKEENVLKPKMNERIQSCEKGRIKIKSFTPKVNRNVSQSKSEDDFLNIDSEQINISDNQKYVLEEAKQNLKKAENIKWQLQEKSTKMDGEIIEKQSKLIELDEQISQMNLRQREINEKMKQKSQFVINNKKIQSEEKDQNRIMREKKEKKEFLVKQLEANENLKQLNVQRYSEVLEYLQKQKNQKDEFIIKFDEAIKNANQHLLKLSQLAKSVNANQFALEFPKECSYLDEYSNEQKKKNMRMLQEQLKNQQQDPESFSYWNVIRRKSKDSCLPNLNQDLRSVRSKSSMETNNPLANSSFERKCIITNRNNKDMNINNNLSKYLENNNDLNNKQTPSIRTSMNNKIIIPIKVTSDKMDQSLFSSKPDDLSVVPIGTDKLTKKANTPSNNANSSDSKNGREELSTILSQIEQDKASIKRRSNNYKNHLREFRSSSSNSNDLCNLGITDENQQQQSGIQVKKWQQDQLNDYLDDHGITSSTQQQILHNNSSTPLKYQSLHKYKLRPLSISVNYPQNQSALSRIQTPLDHYNKGSALPSSILPSSSLSRNNIQNSLLKEKVILPDNKDRMLLNEQFEQNLNLSPSSPSKRTLKRKSFQPSLEEFQGLNAIGASSQITSKIMDPFSSVALGCTEVMEPYFSFDKINQENIPNQPWATSQFSTIVWEAINKKSSKENSITDNQQQIPSRLVDKTSQLNEAQMSKYLERTLNEQALGFTPNRQKDMNKSYAIIAGDTEPLYQKQPQLLSPILKKERRYSIGQAEEQPMQRIGDLISIDSISNRQLQDKKLSPFVFEAYSGNSKLKQSGSQVSYTVFNPDGRGLKRKNSRSISSINQSDGESNHLDKNKQKDQDERDYKRELPLDQQSQIIKLENEKMKQQLQEERFQKEKLASMLKSQQHEKQLLLEQIQTTNISSSQKQLKQEQQLHSFQQQQQHSQSFYQQHQQSQQQKQQSQKYGEQIQFPEQNSPNQAPNQRKRGLSTDEEVRRNNRGKVTWKDVQKRERVVEGDPVLKYICIKREEYPEVSQFNTNKSIVSPKSSLKRKNYSPQQQVNLDYQQQEQEESKQDNYTIQKKTQLSIKDLPFEYNQNSEYDFEEQRESFPVQKKQEIVSQQLNIMNQQQQQHKQNIVTDEGQILSFLRNKNKYGNQSTKNNNTSQSNQ